MSELLERPVHHAREERARTFRFTLLTVALDVVMAVFAVVGVYLWSSLSRGPSVTADSVWAFPFFVVMALWARGLYRKRLRIQFFEEIAPLVGAASIATLMVLLAIVLLEGDENPGPLVLRLWLIGVVLLLCGRFGRSVLQRRLRRRSNSGTPTLIVGAGVIGAHVARRLHSNTHYGLRPIGFLDSQPLPSLLWDERTPILGGPSDLVEVVRATGARHVVFAFSSDPDRQLLRVSRQCHALGIDVSVVPRLFDAVNDRVSVEHLGGLPLFALRQVDPRGRLFAAKHVFDVSVAAVAIIVLAPLLLTLALAVRLSSSGPIFFRQLRVGRDGQTFEVLKFRSMAAPKESTDSFRPLAGHAPGGVEGEDRRTRIGVFMRRTSLDELPQLFNVLKGEMSLVGPRPERPEFVELFREEIERYGERHRVKAGITGWAQVNRLRGQTSIADRAEWDNYYIENWSMKLDMKILVKTVLTLFRRAE